LAGFVEGKEFSDQMSLVGGIMYAVPVLPVTVPVTPKTGLGFTVINVQREKDEPQE